MPAFFLIYIGRPRTKARTGTMTFEDGDFREFSNEDRDKNVGGRQFLKIFFDIRGRGWRGHRRTANARPHSMKFIQPFFKN